MDTLDSTTLMNSLLSLCLGLGLAAACGFRVFVPLLGVSVAALSGHLRCSSGFEWLATWPAFGVLLTATVLEIVAYYVPWVDNFLDSLATPAAVVAGTIVTASVISDMSPLVKWSLAVIAGGGVAGTIQSGTVAMRGVSSVGTLGMANFAVATGELGLSAMFTILAFVLPLVALMAVIGVFILGLRYVWIRRSRAADAAKVAVPASTHHV